MRFRACGIDVVVHVDANGPGHDLRKPRINIGRNIQPRRPEKNRPAGAPSNRQKFSSRNTSPSNHNIGRYKRTLQARSQLLQPLGAVRKLHCYSLPGLEMLEVGQER